MKFDRRGIKIIFFTVVLIVYVIFGIIDGIYIKKTRDIMASARENICAYFAAKGSLPANLWMLSGKDVKDNWRRDIIYKTDKDFTVTLTSLGMDGLPGGDGENADIVLKFNAAGLNKK